MQPFQHLTAGVAGAAMALALVVPSAQAIDFSGLPIAYVEDFQGESGATTTPNYDLLGIGPVTHQGTLDGSAALFTVSPSGPFTAAHIPVVDQATVSTFGSNVGSRVEYASMSFSGDGAASTGLDIWFTDPALRVTGRVEITRTGGAYSATFTVAEFDVDNATEITESVSLTSGQATAIGTGAAFRIDVLVDVAALTAVATLETDNVLVATTPTLALEDLTTDGTLANLVGGITAPPGPGTNTVAIELRRHEAYTQAGIFQPFLNVDVSGSANVPSSNFAAAGGPGTWNVVSLSPVALLDVNGAPSGASVDVDAPSITVGEGAMPPDLVRLLGDHAFECFAGTNDWSMSFSGLSDGLYRVILYAPASSLSIETGTITINGAFALPNLPGAFPAELTENVSWAAATAIVAGGPLTIAGNNGAACAGIAGVQIEALQPIPKVPVAGAVGWSALVASVLALGGAAIRRRC